MDKPCYTKLYEEDLDAVVAIEQACFATPWNREQFCMSLKSNYCHLYGVKLGSQVCAYILYTYVDTCMEIINIATLASCRHKGMATFLFEHLFKEKFLGHAKITLEVRSKNLPALALYRKFLFKAVGMRKNYYKDDDAIIMSRVLS